MPTSNGEPWEDYGEEWKGEDLNPNTDARGEEWKAQEVYISGLRLPRAYHYFLTNGWPAPTPPKDFPSIDAYLEAEQSGQLDQVPIHEPYWLTVVHTAWEIGGVSEDAMIDLYDRMSTRQTKRWRNPWPRVCCVCSQEFRTMDGRQQKAKSVRCVKCRKGRRV